MGGDAERMPRVGALILAAGASARYGQPKQFLRYEGQSLLRRAAEAAVGSGCDPVVVVLGASAARCAAELRGLPVRVAANTAWREGMWTSLRAGLECLSAAAPDAGGVAVMLCDQPLVSRHTIAALVRRYRESGASIVASAYAGTLGVPALFDRSLFGRLGSLPSQAGARGIIESGGDGVQAIPFPEGSIDIDTPRDYEVLQGLDATRPRFRRGGVGTGGAQQRLSRGRPR